MTAISATRAEALKQEWRAIAQRAREREAREQQQQADAMRPLTHAPMSDTDVALADWEVG